MIGNKRPRGQPKYRRPQNRGNMNGGTGQASSAIITQPRLKPVVRFSRTITGEFDIACDGLSPELGNFSFTLNLLPDYTDFTNLFQSYKIDKIQILYKPEYTELTDAALVSNAVNVNFNSVIDQTDPGAPTSVTAVTQYQTCKSTGITKIHKRSFTPAMLTGSSMPCSCYISTNNPSEKHYGFKYAIPPTGASMTFRSTVKIFFSCAGAR